MKNDSKFIRAPEEISNIKEINFFWEGKPYVGKEGDTIASALLACGIGYTRHSSGKEPRAPFCMMGTCFECRVEVNGNKHVQSCSQLLEEGMRISRQSC